MSRYSIHYGAELYHISVLYVYLSFRNLSKYPVPSKLDFLRYEKPWRDLEYSSNFLRSAQPERLEKSLLCL